jgi:hypothetical protein
MGKSNRAVSLRWSLLRSFLLLVLISSLTLFAMMQYRAAQTEQTLSVELTQSGLTRARARLSRFLEPARIGSQLGIAWGRDHLIDLAAAVDGAPGTVTTPQWLLLRLEDGRLRNRVVARDAWGATGLWLDVDHDGAVAGATWQEIDYDPRTRPWYLERNGLRHGEPYWTEASTTGDLGITVSNGWKQSDTEHVIAFDVLLTTLSDFTIAKAPARAAE